MLIWLPPSEGKNAPAVGSALSLESLSHTGLTADRRKVADALIELGAGSQAASTLKVGDRGYRRKRGALDGVSWV